MKNVERLCKQDSWTTAFDCLLYRNLQDVDESYVYKNIWILYFKKKVDFILSWGCRDLAKIGLATMAKKRKEKKKEKELEYTKMTYLKKLNWKKE